MLIAVGAAGRAAAAAGPDATVGIGRVIRTIPPSFLGVSVEYPELARYERLPAFGAFLRQLTAPGSGPLSLRIGGETADNTYLSAADRLPGWSYVLTPAWFAGLSKLVATLGARVIIDMNLAARSPSRAAALARDVLATLPRGSLDAFEIGNEPDLFRFGVVGLRKVTRRGPRQFQWALSYTPQAYAADFAAYAAALRAPAAGVPLAGPASADPTATWWSALPVGRGKLGLVSVHRYPFAACGRHDAPNYPTTAGFLAATASARIAGSVAASVAFARRRGLPVRVTELGSASCTGQAGVTDTFATALWAPDALFSLLAAGVDGVNVHTRFKTPNTPLFGLPSLQARPLFYGMILFARMLGQGADLQATTLAARSALPLSAWAVRLGNGAERLLLINKGGRRLNVNVALPAHPNAMLGALRAPSPTATSGVTLDGQTLGTDGLWHGQTTIGAARRRPDGTYPISLPAYSAELLATG